VPPLGLAQEQAPQLLQVLLLGWAQERALQRLVLPRGKVPQQQGVPPQLLGVLPLGLAQGLALQQ